LFPLIALVAIGLVPYFLQGGKLPGIVKPLLGFALASVIAAGVAAFLPLLPYKGQDAQGREIRALATLAIGLGFYLCATLLPNTEARRRASVRAICRGMRRWDGRRSGIVALTRPDPSR
jgi:hypothetical protein